MLSVKYRAWLWQNHASGNYQKAWSCHASGKSVKKQNLYFWQFLGPHLIKQMMHRFNLWIGGIVCTRYLWIWSKTIQRYLVHTIPTDALKPVHHLYIVIYWYTLLKVQFQFHNTSIVKILWNKRWLFVLLAPSTYPKILYILLFCYPYRCTQTCASFVYCYLLVYVTQSTVPISQYKYCENTVK